MKEPMSHCIPSAPLLTLEEISVAFSGHQVLDRVSLTLQAGEIVTLIGPNGAGKTTLLRVALGLQPPSQGHRSQRQGLTIGYMPQRLNVDAAFPLSVERFLRLGARASRPALEKVLQETGISQLAQAALQDLSGGELQRALLARALLREPELLVLDEPLQGVDVIGQVEIFQLLTRIRNQRGCAILMVSHDLHLVMAATDRVVCLNRHVCCTGTPEVITREQGFVDLFGRQAAEELAIYRHNQGQAHLNCDHGTGHEHD